MEPHTRQQETEMLRQLHALLEPVPFLEDNDPQHGRNLFSSADEALEYLERTRADLHLVTLRGLRDCSLGILKMCAESHISMAFQAKLGRLSCRMMDLSFPNKQLCTAADYCMLIRVFLKAADSAIHSGPEGDAVTAQEALDLFDRAEQLWNRACDSLQQTFVARNGLLGYDLFARRMHAAQTAGDWKKALDSAQKLMGCFNDPEIIPQSSTLSKMCYNAGVTLHSQGEYHTATKWFELALNLMELDKSSPKWKERHCKMLRAMGQSFMHMEDYAQALHAIQRSLLSHTTIETLFLKVQTLLQLQRFGEVIDDMRALLQHNECSLEMALSACEFACRFNSELAKLGYQLVSEKFSGAPEIPLSKLRALRKAGLLEDLEQHFSTVVQEPDRFSMEQRNQAVAEIWSVASDLSQKGQPGLAAAWLQRLTPLIPDLAGRAMCFRALSLTAFEMENFEKALDWASEALSLQPDHQAAYLHRIRALLHLGRVEQGG